MHRLLIKLDRFLAWVLFGSMLLYFISGYGMTKGIISTELATKLHISWLTYIVLVAFVGHTAYAIHLAFKRWNFWGGFGKAIWALFFLFFIGGFVYVDRFYSPASPTNKSVREDEQSTDSAVAKTNGSSADSSAATTQSPTTNVAKTFTLAQLAKYNGENGSPAYVAVSGKVYDLSSVFVSGRHFSHYAGTELTNAFLSYHASQVLQKYPVVGVLVQ